MTTATKRLFGAFSKVEEQPDGTVYVEGIASTETRDSQGEIVKASAMKAAISKYLRPDGTGPLREMHQLKAAGKTTDVWVDDTGATRVAAIVVDSEACKKVKAGVYQGFSIGGNVPPGGRNKADHSVIEALDWTELSLVDRGANPDATYTLVKIDAPAAAAAEPVTPSPAAAEPVASTTPPEPVPAAVAGETPTAKAEPAPAVRKGMFQIACAAEVLAGLQSLQQDTAWEAQFEGDASAIPGRIKALAAELGAILQDMVAEEVAEANAAMPEADAVAMADRVTAAVRDAVVKALAPAPVAKADDADALRKRADDAEAATKAAGEALTKVMAERDALKADLVKAHVELQRKGVLRAVPVSKSDDGQPVAKDDAPLPPEGTPERALAEIKKVHASGGRRLA